MLIIQACFLLLGMYRNFLSFSWFIIYDMGTFYESLGNLHFNATLIFFLSLVFIEELYAFFSNSVVDFNPNSTNPTGFQPKKKFNPVENVGWIPKNFQSRLKIWVAIFNPVGEKFSTRLKKKIWVEYRLTWVDLKYFCILLNLRQLLLEYLSISFDPSKYYLFKINQK